MLVLVLIFGSIAVSAQVNPPGDSTDKRILLLNGTAHIGNGEVIKKSAIAVHLGKITMVKNALLITVKEEDYDTIIDITGQHVYPSFIAPNSTVGLQEIGAVRATRDQRETGTMNPHVRSAIAFNTDSRVMATVKTNGVLVGQICPRGGRISGTSSVMHFDAWNWEDALYKTDDAIHINWPGMYRYDWSSGTRKASKEYDKQRLELMQFMDRALAYSEVKKQETLDLRMEAMKGVFDGSKKVFVHADFVKELEDIIEFKKKYELNLVIVGGYDSHLIAENLKNQEIAVVLRRVHELPRFEEDDVDLPYKLPKLLQDAGVKFCLNNQGDMEQMGTRNLPFYAGTAIAYGLTYEEAVASITSNTAEILGVDDKLGTLEVGKDATLLVSKGDALDMRTNELTVALVQGRFMSLTNHQDELYEKYVKKYGLNR